MAWVLALAGCSTTWNHPAKSSSEFQQDLYECERDAAPQVDPVFRRRMMDRCLSVKGWRKQ